MGCLIELKVAHIKSSTLFVSGAVVGGRAAPLFDELLRFIIESRTRQGSSRDGIHSFLVCGKIFERIYIY